MRAAQLRVWVIGLIVAAAVISFIGNRSDSKVVNAIGLGAFLAAVLPLRLLAACRQERARC